MATPSTARRANSERRLTELGTGNWNNRGIDNHIKRPAGVSSAGLKRGGMKRIDGIPHPVGCGNTSDGMEASLKYPKQCLVSNEHVYDGDAIKYVPSYGVCPFDSPAAGIEASKTVQYNNYAALSTDKAQSGPEHGQAPSWLLGAQTKRRIPAPFQQNANPIKHEHVKPHKTPTRPIRRMGPTGNDGPHYDGGAAALNWNLQHQQRNTGPLPFDGMNAKDWKTVANRQMISPLGEILYSVGGHEDLRPTGYAEYQKCDKPATLMTQYENDSRQLASFERERRKTDDPPKPNLQLLESDDMIMAMCGGSRSPSNLGGSEFSQRNEIGPSPYDDYNSATASEYSLRSGDAGPEWKPKPERSQRRRPKSARADARRSPSLSVIEEGSRSGRGGARTPISARGSDRYERDSQFSYRNERDSQVSYRSEGDNYRGGDRNDRGSEVSYRTGDSQVSYRTGDSQFSYRSERDGYRDYDRSSIRSSYYSESDGGRKRDGGNRRSKSADASRFTGGQRNDRGARGFSDRGSPMSGMFSDPSRTVTEQALNEALRSAPGFGKSQRSPRR